MANFLESLKFKAKIKPIFKKGKKDNLIIIHYLSLLPILSKIIENVMNVIIELFGIILYKQQIWFL